MGLLRFTGDCSPTGSANGRRWIGLSLTELCGGDGGGTEGVRQALTVQRTTDREVMGQATPTGKGVSVGVSVARDAVVRRGW